VFGSCTNLHINSLFHVEPRSLLTLMILTVILKILGILVFMYVLYFFGLLFVY
jgi:hypothetical protein